ncbi:leucyl aminopeptidase family protein [Aeropyrum camini]|uniref:Probable cytosol aminopeptidase n=1 Tax=Aeropyrum camini SY1 = JCM 12091 TaxID=1198449 RepID=U3TBU0_9CREN|nr:M17 family peptidase N-terminal domain-containing protein [Aeropyrum camini]BAN91007.1 leucine aminopeptidase [Aeropyrum camini SY1 = JCM 12091]
MVLYTKPPSVTASDEAFFGRRTPVIVPVFKEGDSIKLPEGLPEDLASLIRDGYVSKAVSPEPGSTAKLPYKGGLVVTAGCGAPGDLEGVRRGFAAASRQVIDSFEEAQLYLSGLDSNSSTEALIGSLLGAYRLEEFKNTRKRKLQKLWLYGGSPRVDYAQAIAEGVYLARDIANAPPHRLPPAKLAATVKDLFSQFDNVDVEIFSYERLVEDGFGGIVSVGMGSDEKPRLIIIRYTGGSGEPIALVGKAVVFDSGGINLKPSQGMTLMRADKAGGAAVAGALWAAARLGIKANLVGLIPAVINVPSGSSYLPSDVIRMWDGTLVEITNTDAEGRLILADAIAYAAKQLGAKTVIDLATLTGAIVVALGPLIAGLFTRSDSLAKAFEEASKITGEKLWRMPMEDEYAKSLTQPAQAGEIVNAAQRYGGAIFGALFLERFAHGKEFAHLDIAGPGIAFEAGSLAPPYWPEKGMAPGYGVRLLIEVLNSRAGGGG